jgi:hypothetical protein
MREKEMDETKRKHNEMNESTAIASNHRYKKRGKKPLAQSKTMSNKKTM